MTQLTIMQLILSRIIKVEVEATKKRSIAHCELCFDKEERTSPTCMKPTHFIDVHWSRVKMN